MLTLFAFGAVCVCIVMLALWLLSLHSGNFSYVDIGWAANFVVLAIVFVALGNGYFGRRLIMGCMYAFAGVRLALHLGARIVGHPEEGRYVQLRREWGSGGHLARNFLIFFQAQALLNLILCVPLALAVMNPTPSLQIVEYVGAALWFIAFAGESIADRQLARFKSNPRNAGRVCDIGLWSVSRHPNYFFEWLIWVSYAVFAWASPFGWLALAMPLLMLHFLVNVTGVKPTEEQALRSRGDAYRQYQRSVSMFFPWFPKHGVAQ
ncbi:MAG: DUF1295 domain-containing protein [Povalibacter sp.]